MVQSDKTILSYPQIAQIAQYSVNGVNYSILRKARTTPPAVVTVKGDTLSIKDLTRGSVSWVTELESAASTAITKKTSVFLVSSLIPAEGINNFIEELRSDSKFKQVRAVFSLDNRREVNIKDPLIQKAFKQDLTVTVIKDGVLGGVLPVPIKLKSDVQNNMNITTNAMQNKTLNYIGINLRDETLLPSNVQKKDELGNIDYSGVTSSGQNVMGLAQLDRDVCKLVPDPILTWDIPESWKLEDAVTIPYAYSGVSIFEIIILWKYKRLL